MIAALVLAAQIAAVADSREGVTVRAYVAAYNAHDVEGVVKMLHPDFVWLNVDGDTVGVEVRGQDGMRASLHGYFKSFPSARSQIETLSALGPWVSVRERAHWQGKDGPRSQAAMSVYEVRDGLLRRVWYYPSVK